MLEMARTAEELGYDSFTVTDRRPGGEGGGVPGEAYFGAGLKADWRATSCQRPSRFTHTFR
jgi:hypothetical protein